MDQSGATAAVAADGAYAPVFVSACAGSRIIESSRGFGSSASAIAVAAGYAAGTLISKLEIQRRLGVVAAKGKSRIHRCVCCSVVRRGVHQRRVQFHPENIGLYSDGRTQQAQQEAGKDRRKP
jgi:homoserine kinase